VAIIASAEDAQLLLSKWASEGTQLLVALAAKGAFASTLRTSIASLTEDEIDFGSARVLIKNATFHMAHPNEFEILKHIPIRHLDSVLSINVRHGASCLVLPLPDAP
jgi:hypothetical protein